jgi:hypothetical protein
MSPEMLAFIIASFCQIKNPNITKTHKLDCIEYMTNCSVLQDGKTTSKQVAECQEKWVEIERKRK